MTTPLRIRRDINGNQTYGLSFSDDSYWAQIPAATEGTLTVPNGVTDAFFAFTKASDVYVRLNGSTLTTPPSGATLQLAGETELNPGSRKVEAGDTLRFYCEDICEVVVNFYKTTSDLD
jgi:hypothetical protein